MYIIGGLYFRRLIYEAANKPDVIDCFTLYLNWFLLVWKQWLFVAACTMFFPSLLLLCMRMNLSFLWKRLCSGFGDWDYKWSEFNVSFGRHQVFTRSNHTINLLNWILWIYSVPFSSNKNSEIWASFSCWLFQHRTYCVSACVMHAGTNCIMPDRSGKKTTIVRRWCADV